MRPFISIFLATIFLVGLLVGSADARKWTDRQGRTIDAQYVRLDGQTVVVQEGKKYRRIPLDTLSDADCEYVRGQNGGKLPGDAPDKIPASNPAQALGEAFKLFTERTWTDKKGKKWRGTFISTSGKSVKLSVDGKSKFISLTSLSAADLRFMRDNWDPRLAAPDAPEFATVRSAPRTATPRVATPDWYSADQSPSKETNVERWWHTPKEFHWGALRSIGLDSIGIKYQQIPFSDLIEYETMPPSEVAYILAFLDRSGQQPLIEKILERHPNILSDDSNPKRSIEPEISEEEATNNPIADWNTGSNVRRGRVTNLRPARFDLYFLPAPAPGVFQQLSQSIVHPGELLPDQFNVLVNLARRHNDSLLADELLIQSKIFSESKRPRFPVKNTVPPITANPISPPSTPIVNPPIAPAPIATLPIAPPEGPIGSSPATSPRRPMPADSISHCPSCKKWLDGDYRVGDECPHCGIVIRSASESSGNIANTVIVVAAIGLVGAGIAACVLVWRAIQTPKTDTTA